MKPERAARLLATAGVLLLLLLVCLRGYSLVTLRMQAAQAGMQTSLPGGEEAILGNYVFSGDGQRVAFQQAGPGQSPAWYWIDARGGLATDGKLPEGSVPVFELRDGVLMMQLSQEAQGLRASPPGLRVTEYAEAPDRQSAAFTGYPDGGEARLYVFSVSSGLSWLGEAQAIHDLQWTPDGAWLVYRAPTAGTDQIFRARPDGSRLEQLTRDSLRKADVRVSPDGKRIAFLAVDKEYPIPEPQDETAGEDLPTTGGAGIVPAWSELYVLDADGNSQRRLDDSQPGKTNLHWINGGSELAYEALPGLGERITFLYATAPDKGTTRRVYPSLALERLDCPASLPHAGQGTLRLTITSSALTPTPLRVTLRAAARPFESAPLKDDPMPTLQTETLMLPPGETTREWTVTPVKGPTSVFSAAVDAPGALFFSSQTCQTRNRYLGLPDIPLLPVTLPLLAVGMALMIPWLRHQNRRLFWAMWAGFPGLVAGLIAAEILLLPF